MRSHTIRPSQRLLGLTCLRAKKKRGIEWFLFLFHVIGNRGKKVVSVCVKRSSREWRWCIRLGWSMYSKTGYNHRESHQTINRGLLGKKIDNPSNRFYGHLISWPLEFWRLATLQFQSSKEKCGNWSTGRQKKRMPAGLDFKGSGFE